MKTDYTQMKVCSKNMVMLLDLLSEELSNAFSKDENFNTDFGGFLATTYYQVENIKLNVLERVREGIY